ncbi:hypothetical protein DH2020_011021 [Rehmannia glutinosa]|uniref:RING-type E3 ubiquitin transferase n=1 Tax=Rehmannia glutinosa TaxID=99300 RepID=A0ABR0XC56_REHGL
MAFRFRKLLNESAAVDPGLSDFCEPFCNEAKNPDAICPFTCIDLCPPSCKTPLPPIPPPPPPSAPDIAVFNHPPDKAHGLSLFLTISLAGLATAFFFFTCYTVYKFYSNWYGSRRRRQSQRRRPEEEDGGGPTDFFDEDHGPVVDHPIWYIRTIGLQPSVISAITIVNYKKGDGLIESTDCSVCLNEFQDDETLRLLPKCNHAFHITCIDTWLRSHTNCPTCRAGIVNNTAVLPTPELIVQDSGLVEEARISGSNREVERESENEPSELRITGIEDDTVSRAENGPKISEEEGNSDSGGLDGIQPMRRSVSMDYLSVFPGQSDGNLVEVKESSTDGVVTKRVGFNQGLLRLIGSPLIERSSIQTGSCSIKRSVSCSANVHSSTNQN